MLIITRDVLFLSVGVAGCGWLPPPVPVAHHRVNSTMQPFSNRAPLVGDAQPDERNVSFIETGTADANPLQPERTEHSCLFTTL